MIEGPARLKCLTGFLDFKPIGLLITKTILSKIKEDTYE